MSSSIDIERQIKLDQHRYYLRQFASDVARSAGNSNVLSEIQNSLLSELVDASKKALFELEGIRLQQAHQNLLKQYELRILSKDQYARKALVLGIVTFIEYIDLVSTSDSTTLDLLYLGREHNLLSHEQFLTEVESRGLNVELYLNNLFSNHLIDQKDYFHRMWELGKMTARAYLGNLIDFHLIEEHEVVHLQKELGLIDEKQWLDTCYQKNMISSDEYFPRRLSLAESEFRNEFSHCQSGYLPIKSTEDLRIKANLMFDKICSLRKEGQARCSRNLDSSEDFDEFVSIVNRALFPSHYRSGAADRQNDWFYLCVLLIGVLVLVVMLLLNYLSY